MKKVLIVVLVLVGIAFVLFRLFYTVNERSDLSPKCERGDIKRYTLTVTGTEIGEDGDPIKEKTNTIDFYQKCLSNNPDSGIVYETVIDEFRVGPYRGMGYDRTNSRLIEQLSGFRYECKITDEIPLAGGCYDHGFELTADLYYLQTFELFTDIIPIRLLEQLRYSAQSHLSVVGDSIAIVMPGPICLKIPRVVEEFQIDGLSLNLVFADRTTYSDNLCARIELTSEEYSVHVILLSQTLSSVDLTGTARMDGDFLVSLDRGEIVRARLRTRLDGNLVMPDSTVRPNRVVQTYKLDERL